MKLRRPFVIASGSITAAESLFLRFEDDAGHTGWGEATPAPRVTQETDEMARRSILDYERNEEWVERLLEDAEHVPGGTRTPSVRSALLTAHLDAIGRVKGLPLHRLLNLPEGRIHSSVTVSLGTPQAALKEAVEYAAAKWDILKVKLGGPHDEAVLRALRDAYPDKTLRVDANEAWRLDEARKKLELCQRLEVELVEQPLPRDQLTESRILAREFEIPIILDESVLDTGDVVDVVREEAGDGINVKLAKCGGPYEARRMVKIARDHDWKVMIGCMVESSLGVAAAASFAGIVDYADLDGNVFLAQDPFTGFRVQGGLVATPTAPGVGVAEGPAAAQLARLAASARAK